MFPSMNLYPYGTSGFSRASFSEMVAPLDALTSTGTIPPSRSIANSTSRALDKKTLLMPCGLPLHQSIIEFSPEFYHYNSCFQTAKLYQISVLIVNLQLLELIKHKILQLFRLSTDVFLQLFDAHIVSTRDFHRAALGEDARRYARLNVVSEVAEHPASSPCRAKRRASPVSTDRRADHDHAIGCRIFHWREPSTPALHRKWHRTDLLAFCVEHRD